MVIDSYCDEEHCVLFVKMWYCADTAFKLPQNYLENNIGAHIYTKVFSYRSRIIRNFIRIIGRIVVHLSQVCDVPNVTTKRERNLVRINTLLQKIEGLMQKLSVKTLNDLLVLRLHQRTNLTYPQKSFSDFQWGCQANMFQLLPSTLEQN